MSPVCICLKKATTQSSVQTVCDICAYLQQFLVTLKKKKKDSFSIPVTYI